MNTHTTKNYDQVVTDDGGIMVAEFSAINSDGLHNISLVINSPELYMANKDKVMSSFDQFLIDIQADSSDIH